MDTTKKPIPLVAAVITILILGGLTAAIIYLTNQQNTTEQTTTSEKREVDVSEATNPGGYANGTYSAVGNYTTPGGTDSIGLTVTLENGVIVSTELEQHATSGNSAQFQGQFASGYADLVVGKDIDEVRLSRVAGSSLTSNGFNEALEEIKEEARAAS